MRLKEIYLNGIEGVIKGGLSKEDLWDIFDEHLQHKEKANKKLQDALDGVQDNHKRLLKLVSDAHKEHKEITKHEI